MHNLIKFAAAVVVGMSVCACSGGGAHIAFEEKEYEKDGARANVRTVMLDGKDELNEQEELRAQEMLDEFIKRCDGKDEARLDADSSVVMNNGSLVSVVLEGEADFGGARAEKFRYCRTVDINTGTTFRLSDVFADDGWRTFADARMAELAGSGIGEYEDLWEQPSADMIGEESFYIKGNKMSGDKIVFYFQPYELSYYRKGFVEFEFALKDFSGYFSEEFRNAAKI